MRPIALFSFILLSVSSSAQKLIDYVNPFIGTAAHGHTYPGATLPFGMVQLSPDNGRGGWDWCSGYNYSDSVIVGFSHTHLSGTGIGDLCDISVMPTVGRKPDTLSVRSKFSHQQESSKPGYYSVLLKDYNIKAELTASNRCGLHQYTFPASNDATIRFDLGFAINWDRPTQTFFRKINDSTFAGFRFSSGWAKDQRVYFAVRLSKPIKDLVLFSDKKIIINATEAKGKEVIAHLVFNTTDKEKVLMKVGLSFANEDGAMRSLTEIEGWNFNKAVATAQKIWENELGKIRITSSDLAFKQTFYTALYHTYLAPVTYSDLNGNYKGADGNIHKGENITTVQSLWDTFRAANPLLTITQPGLVPAIINSYLAFYKQHGLLPVWDLYFNETNTMTGYHAVPIIADAILKNIQGFDHNIAYEAMKKSADQNIRGTDFYRQYGYVPQDKHGSSVTITLEYAFDDWCIAQVAKMLGLMDDYKEFMRRSESWKPLFDPVTKFARARHSNGTWYEPFDPYYSEHDFSKAVYTEGNAWQHSWFMPHDVHGLIKMHGSINNFVSKLDSLFSVSSQLKGENASPDISGLIGQYAHGNEPSHHIAYLYNYAGMPYKTAEKVKLIRDSLYSNKPDGLCGNEDCGQMSAWYVFSALGFYPVNAAGGEYVIGTPAASNAAITVGKKTFKVKATDLSNKNIYIQEALLNGKPYTRSYITHTDLLNGGILELKMGSKPSKKWGVGEESLPGKSR